MTIHDTFLTLAGGSKHRPATQRSDNHKSAAAAVAAGGEGREKGGDRDFLLH